MLFLFGDEKSAHAQKDHRTTIPKSDSISSNDNSQFNKSHACTGHLFPDAPGSPVKKRERYNSPPFSPFLSSPPSLIRHKPPLKFTHMGPPCVSCFLSNPAERTRLSVFFNYRIWDSMSLLGFTVLLRKTKRHLNGYPFILRLLF